jgi:hypothetical protein
MRFPVGFAALIFIVITAPIWIPLAGVAFVTAGVTLDHTTGFWIPIAIMIALVAVLRTIGRTGRVKRDLERFAS